MSRLLPYETIIQATNGEPEAVNAVLAHYAGYIRYYSHIYGHYNVEYGGLHQDETDRKPI